MADTLGTIITKGWEDFKANPILIVPGILTFLVIYIYLFALMFSIFPDIMTALSMTGSAYVDPAIIESMVDSFNYGRLMFVTFAGLLFILVFSSFITAGLIGMAKETVDTGKTKLGDFVSYGAKYFFKTLFVTIILGIILSIPIIILTVLFLVIIGLASITGSGAAIAIILMLTLLFVLLICFITIVFSIVFYFPAYAIVLENYGVIDSLQKSYNLFKENKGDVIIFVLVLVVIDIAVMFVSGIVSGLLNIIPIIGLLFSTLINLFVTSILTALMTIWAVRMYYNLNEEKTETEPVYSEYRKFDEYAAIEEGILNSDDPVVDETVSEKTYEEVISENVNEEKE